MKQKCSEGSHCGGPERCRWSGKAQAEKSASRLHFYAEVRYACVRQEKEAAR